MVPHFFGSISNSDVTWNFSRWELGFFPEEAVSYEAFFEVDIYNISSLAWNSPRRPSFLPFPPYLMKKPYFASDGVTGDYWDFFK